MRPLCLTALIACTVLTSACAPFQPIVDPGARRAAPISTLPYGSSGAGGGPDSPRYGYGTSIARGGNFEQDTAECQALAVRAEPGDVLVTGALGGAVVGALGARLAGRNKSRNRGAAVGALIGGLGAAAVLSNNQASIVRNCMRGRGHQVLN